MASPRKVLGRVLPVVGLVLSLCAAGLIFLPNVFYPLPRANDPNRDFPGSDKFCLDFNLPTGATAPYPAVSLTPVGQPAQTTYSWFIVPAAAERVKQTDGETAAGVFVQVRIQEKYTGDLSAGVSTFPLDFQLVDPTGAVHCVVLSATADLNRPLHPESINSSYLWSLRLLPGDPPTDIILVFDLDPGLVQGAYLRAYGVASRDSSVSLSLGLDD